MKALAVLIMLTSLTIAPSPAHASGAPLTVEVLSSRPDQVSGGDALVRVRQTRGHKNQKIKVLRNGEDVTSAFTKSGDALQGLVTGLTVGNNTITPPSRARPGGT